MNCYYHNGIVSVANCTECKKGVCKSCYDKFSIAICISCFSKKLSLEKEKIKSEFKWMIGFGLFGLFNSISVIYSMTSFDKNSTINFKQFLILSLIYIIIPILFIYIFASFVSGWKTLNEFGSKLINSWYLTLVAWFIYYAVILVLTFILSPIISPFRVYSKYKRLKVINQTLNNCS